MMKDEISKFGKMLCEQCDPLDGKKDGIVDLSKLGYVGLT